MPAPTPQSPAPKLEVDLVGGGRFVLADQHPDNFTLIVFYRGWHCPICRSYLTQLHRALSNLDALGVTTVTVSGDSERRARQSVDEWKLEGMNVGYGQTAASMPAWGLYVSKGVKEPEPDLFAEPGIYLVRPDNTIYMAALNSMPAARPRIDDLVGAVRFFIENDYPARGET